MDNFIYQSLIEFKQLSTFESTVGIHRSTRYHRRLETSGILIENSILKHRAVFS